jgi:hypothetical protein
MSKLDDNEDDKLKHPVRYRPDPKGHEPPRQGDVEEHSHDIVNELLDGNAHYLEHAFAKFPAASHSAREGVRAAFSGSYEASSPLLRKLGSVEPTLSERVIALIGRR